MPSYNNDKTRFRLKIEHIRGFSTFSSQPVDNPATPIPIKVFHNLNNNETVISYNKILINKAGIYYFINTVNNKRYIGSAKYLYLRLIEHLANKKSNTAFQSAILKYGLDKFEFFVYKCFTYHSKIVSNKALTDLETSYIKKYPFDILYTFMRTATSL